jgi:serine/threonine-protein kinase
MSQLTSKQFIELLRRSQVLDDTKLATIIRSLKSGPAEERNDPNRLAQRLVNDGVITTWHAQKLLAKKCKGFVLGKYLLLHHIGSGGMSHVYLAQHRLIGRRVAVKVLPPDKVKDAGYLDRFLREARAAAQLDHPNIVRAYDVDSQENLHFIVMEYVEGIDLHKKVKREGVLSFDEAASFVAQAARGLHHAHLAKLVHRDVKPSNLLVNSEGTVKVLDLGLAMFSDEALAKSDALTKSNSVLGTADYLSPEQARDCHDIDYRADIYSLGCTLYYLLTGGPPFPGGTFAQRILKHQLDTPVPIRNHRPDCPSILSDVCERMMQKDPEDRFQSVLEIDEQLTKWLKSTFVNANESPISIVVYEQTNDESEPTGNSTSNQRQRPEPVESPTDTNTPAAKLSPPDDNAPVKVDAFQSVVARRRETQKTSVKVPIMMWVTIGALAIVCICLAVFVVMQSH